MITPNRRAATIRHRAVELGGARLVEEQDAEDAGVQEHRRQPPAAEAEAAADEVAVR
jgi:hypothetical protein